MELNFTKSYTETSSQDFCKKEDSKLIITDYSSLEIKEAKKFTQYNWLSQKSSPYKDWRDAYVEESWVRLRVAAKTDLIEKLTVHWR